MNEKRGPIRKRFPVDLHNLANGRTAIIFLALWLLFVILLQMTDRPLADLAGGETKLDLRFGYDFQTVQTLFNSYGPQGRELYLGNLEIDPGLVRLASAITRPKLIAAMMTYGILILSALVIAGRYARNQLARWQTTMPTPKPLAMPCLETPTKPRPTS